MCDIYMPVEKAKLEDAVGKHSTKNNFICVKKQIHIGVLLEIKQDGKQNSRTQSVNIRQRIILSASIVPYGF